MANLIPLNYFNRVIATVSATPFAFYTTPYNRAGIVIAALATNLTSSPQSVTVGLSSSADGYKSNVWSYNPAGWAGVITDKDNNTIWSTLNLVDNTNYWHVTNSGWDSFMNNTAVWVNNGTNTLVGIPQTISGTLNLSVTGNYTLSAQADNRLNWYIDNKLVLASTSFNKNNIDTATIYLGSGSHDIRGVLTNDLFEYNTIVNGFQLQPNDTANLVINKLILNQYDSFIVSTPNANAVNLNVSVLETANTISTNTPLNYFRRISQAITTTPTPVYTAPYNVAGIVITALASNLTNQNQTVTVSVSTAGTPNSNFVYASNFIVPPNDTANLVNYNKLVLNTNDTFIISAANNNALNITMSILETVNTQ
jgi:hypothetical protein